MFTSCQEKLLTELKQRIAKGTAGEILPPAIQLAQEFGVNICDISQTLMQGYFTMIMLVDLETATVDFETLRKELAARGMEIGVDIRIQHQDLFDSMHKI